MRNEDHVFGLLTDANPIPNIDDLDLREVGGARYLETLDLQRGESFEMDGELPAATQGRHHLVGWMAAALVIIAGTAVVLVNQSFGQDAAAPETPIAAELTGTWDYVLDPALRDLVLENFEGRQGSVNEVVMRVGLDEQEFWQGFLFDGEILLMGDGGPLQREGDRLVLIGGGGELRTTYLWMLGADEVTFTWLEQCWISSNGDDCTDDRLRMENDDPLTIPLWENTFTKISEETSYQLGRQSSQSTAGD